jgi:hypothetical protein
MVVGVGESHVDIDPNQCPCTTGRDSFDGMTLLELGGRKPDRERNYFRSTAGIPLGDGRWSYDFPDPRSTSDEDGHLEVDDWYRRNSEGAP